jgi:hypothetical protein
MSELNTIADGLNSLLASYAEPCVCDCEHSHCPLLRELYALRIKATLEKARLTVRPIVDSEKQGEQVGNLVNMRLHGTTGGERCAESEIKNTTEDPIVIMDHERNSTN